MSLVALAIALLIVWFCYQPATSGALRLDDQSNLGDLASINDRESATRFVLSGNAGPLGRPLSLLTFAWQADSWQNGAAAFLRVNIGIHLLNTLLLAACFFALARQGLADRARCAPLAVVAATCWALLPLLATSSLLVVQRMTTFSALLVLLGLLAYLIFRTALQNRPRYALIGMTLSLVVGTTLAALAKESGLLLPVYVLVLEATVLQRPDSVSMRIWRVWKAVFLVVPLALIVGYLGSRFSYPDSTIARRGFDAPERLLTQATVLWQYLYTAVVGLPGKIGIYQAPPEVVRTLLTPQTLLAVVSWLALTGFAIVWRRKYPLFSLAVLWYLTGHMVESTVVPLELYFEHRNYLPVAGVVFAALAFTLTRDRASLRPAAILVGLFAVFSAANLYQFSVLWGDPPAAARYWAIANPDSVRAVTNLATQQLSDPGPAAALQTLDEFATRYPQHSYLRTQQLNLSCMLQPEIEHTALANQLLRELPSVDFTYTAGAMLSQLSTTIAQGQCRGLGMPAMRQLINALHSNPAYRSDPLYTQYHHKLLASLARKEGNSDTALGHLLQAVDVRPDSELNMMVVTTLAGANRLDEAEDYIELAEQDAPRHPLRRWLWLRDLEDLRRYLAALRAS